MATKEDILEQIVEEYLLHKGYFVRHNIKFLPRRDHPDFQLNQDSNHSDIDVLAIHPLKDGHDKVIAVSCKSWQGGFDPKAEIRAIDQQATRRGRAAWQGFRELCVPKWSKAYVAAIKDATGTSVFTYVTAVTRIRGDKALWESHASFRAAIHNNPIVLLDLATMLSEIDRRLSTTLANTEVGRMLQLMKAAGWRKAT
jgi:hypothetical protein